MSWFDEVFALRRKSNLLRSSQIWKTWWRSVSCSLAPINKCRVSASLQISSKPECVRFLKSSTLSFSLSSHVKSIARRLRVNSASQRCLNLLNLNTSAPRSSGTQRMVRRMRWGSGHIFTHFLISFLAVASSLNSWLPMYLVPLHATSVLMTHYEESLSMRF